MERLHVKHSEDTELAKFLHARVVGQEQAVASIVAQHDKLIAKMADPTRPIASLLFLGPTGVGKTKIVEAYCEFLFGDNQKPLKVNCGEYTHDHQIAKLIGSPAGYLCSDKEPYFSKSRVEGRRTRDGQQLNVVLFDEIEKAGSAEHHGSGANAALNNLMLSIFDRGSLNLSNGTEVDFTKTIIFMTSNLGAQQLIEAGGDESIMKTIAEESARKFFNPEQFNRLDELVVFKPLTPEQILLICDLEITEVADRAKMELDIDDKVREGLAKAGYDIRYGARQFKRTVDRALTRSLAALMATKQIFHNDRIHVGLDENNTVVFFKMEGQTQFEQEIVKPQFSAPLPPKPAYVQSNTVGYVRRMFDLKYPSWADSHGAKIYGWFKKNQFAKATPERIVRDLEAAGWTCNNAGGTLAAAKYVLADWVKKEWAIKLPDGSFAVKE